MSDCFKLGSQILTQHSPSKKFLSKSLMCPSSSLANPMKIPDGAYSCLHGQKMTCNPMSKHLNRVFVCVTNVFTFSPAIPIIVPTCSKYSQIIPGSFPDRSHISQIIPSFAPCPYSFPGVCRGFPIVFSFFPQSFPKSFPILPPNVASAPQSFCPHGFLAYSQGSPRSFFDLITRQALNQFFYKGCNRQNCFTGNPFFPLQKKSGFHCDFTGANTS